jgi:hypothetical protein
MYVGTVHFVNLHSIFKVWPCEIETCNRGFHGCAVCAK